MWLLKTFDEEIKVHITLIRFYTRLMNICGFYIYAELIKNNYIKKIKTD